MFVRIVENLDDRITSKRTSKLTPHATRGATSGRRVDRPPRPPADDRRRGRRPERRTERLAECRPTPMIGDHLRGARAFWDFVQQVRRSAASRTTAAAAGPVPGASPPVDEALARLDAIRDECRAIVNRRASLSAGAALVPLPGLDVGTDIAILLRLLPKINERFGLAPDQIASLDTETKRIVMMFVGTVGSTLVGRLVTRELVVKVLLKLGLRVTTKGVVKFVPLLGQAISASISYGAMKMLGNRHIDDCYEVARRTLLEGTPPVDGSRREGGAWQLVD